MKRKMVALTMAMALAACGLMTGCSGSGESNQESQSTQESGGESKEKQTTITVWRWNMTDERTELINKLNDQFMEEHPDIKVEFTSLPDDASQKLELALESGSGPDVFYPSGNVASYIANGYIIALDDLFEKWENHDVLLESMVEAARSTDNENHKLYNLPDGCNVNCLWIRSDWFSEANLEVPQTWEEVFDAIDKLTDESKERYGVGIRGGSGSAANLEMMMFSYAGITDYFNEDGTCNINDPKMVEFVEKWLGNYGVNSAEGDISNGWTELAAEFQSGRCAIIQHNLGSASSHMDTFEGDTSKFEAVAFPKSAENTVVQPPLSPAGGCISSTCKDQEAAFEYLSWMATGEAASQIQELWGALPADTSVLESAEWIQNTEWMKMAADLLLSEETKFYESPAYLTSYASILTNEIEPMVQSVMSKEMTAQEMCDSWAELMEEAYQEQIGS